ncbi:MAG: hypothetical protein MUF87_18255 [Anaerolineae bacterium]|jgi:hypothetical protein|nr:hypothetical protein [Anaerolineae bacterium]
MADTSAKITQRPDVDIHHDIHNLIVHYPPAAHDHRALHIEVKAGAVKLSGVFKARVTQTYILDKLPNIAGIQSLDITQLYNDDDLRLEVAKVVPFGVYVNLEYGQVKLTGKHPTDLSLETLVSRISAIPGVTRIIAALG